MFGIGKEKLDARDLAETCRQRHGIRKVTASQVWSDAPKEIRLLLQILINFEVGDSLRMVELALQRKGGRRIRKVSVRGPEELVVTFTRKELVEIFGWFKTLRNDKFIRELVEKSDRELEAGRVPQEFAELYQYLSELGIIDI